MHRIVILTEGKSTPDDAKTATGLLRYRPEDVVAVLDSTHAGKKAGEVLGTGGNIPIVARLEDVKGDTLLIGIAPAGGKLPREWRKVIRKAIESGMDVVSGLHYFLSEDAEFRDLAARHRVRLQDVRKPSPDLTVSRNVAKTLRAHRVHTVGHDCSVGKMVAALEITRALKERGRRAEFVATGQTGIMVAGWGVPIDRVISDFLAGAIEEQLVLHADEEFLLIEGQGSLVHPLYSGVTLGLLHGCAPQSMVMVFDPTRKSIKHTDHAMPPLSRVIEIYEAMASLLTPSRVVAIAANTYSLTPREADAVMKRTEDELGLVTDDLIRNGTDRIVGAILARHAELGLAGSAKEKRSAGHRRAPKPGAPRTGQRKAARKTTGRASAAKKQA
ncbi:MAG TPA: DUF1611 domain-containing protein [Planctomycetota bacterium]|nr:DUF1611 domain-containing protein [Planctomycetota bacterium]